MKTTEMAQFTFTTAVERIATLTDPVQRNLQITQSYHEISGALSKRLGPSANWCTFATWASRQAGQTIRHEDLAKVLEHKLSSDPSIGQALFNILKAAAKQNLHLDKAGISRTTLEALNPKITMARAGDAVARGNQKVYAEIALEFARFLDTCFLDSTFDEEKIARFCERLRPGDPPHGQGYLRLAFNSYYQALFETHPKAKAELLLMANICCGFHEQTRLQPEIAEAMEASVPDPKQIKRYLLHSLFPNRWGCLEWAASLFNTWFHQPTPLEEAIGTFATQARHYIRLFLSSHFMELGFPAGVELRLGRDLHASFPPHLTRLEHPGLVGLLKNMDPTPDSLLETGAIDWADLKDRLHFIVDLFRCYQETPELLGPPFDTVQTEAIRAFQSNSLQ